MKFYKYIILSKYLFVLQYKRHEHIYALGVRTAKAKEKIIKIKKG